MHRRCLPLGLSSMWLLGERQNGGQSPQLALPVPEPKRMENNDRKTMPDKTLEVRSSVLCCTAGPLHQAWFRLSSAAALDHSTGLSSAWLWRFFRATSQSRAHRSSEPHLGVTSQRNGKVVSGSSRGWGLQGWSQQLSLDEEREAKMAHFWGYGPYSSPWHHNSQQWFERYRIAT